MTNGVNANKKTATEIFFSLKTKIFSLSLSKLIEIKNNTKSSGINTLFSNFSDKNNDNANNKQIPYPILFILFIFSPY